VVSNFIVQAIRGEDLTLYGDGSQTRSFCYVDDLIDGMMGVMEQEESVGPVNLGNPTEFTIRQLAEAVLGRIVTTSKIMQEPLPADDPTQRKPDISLAQKLLSWNPSVELTAGLDRTIPYFREIIKE
jgi:UDP-glucuronate decarboxylase